MKLDFIKQIMSEFDQSNVTKMKVEIDDLKIELEKESEKVEYVKPLENAGMYSASVFLFFHRNVRPYLIES